MTEHESKRPTEEHGGGEVVGGVTHAARHAADAGRATVARTSQQVREGVARASEYAQDVTDRAGERLVDVSERASDKIADLTGRSPDAWARGLRQFVESSPLKALAVAIGLGYILGRIVRRA